MLWEIHGGTVHQILMIESSEVGFLTVLFPWYLLYGHCRSERLPTRNEPKRKREDGERKKAKGGEGKRLEGCMGVQYFLLRGQSLVNFSASGVLIHRSQGVNTNLYTVCVIVFFLLFLDTSFCCVVSWRRGIFVPSDTDEKARCFFFTDTGPFWLTSSKSL